MQEVSDAFGSYEIIKDQVWGRLCIGIRFYVDGVRYREAVLKGARETEESALKALLDYREKKINEVKSQRNR